MKHQSQISLAAAYRLYAQYLHENPEVRNKKGIIHVSDIIYTGWECGRFLGYIRMVEERINDTQTFPPELHRTFWIGEGIEAAANHTMRKAMQHYVDTVGGVLHSVRSQVPLNIKEYGLTGNMDFVAEYTLGDENFFHVIDTKSTSSTAQTKRQVGNNPELSTADVGYDRQLSAYVKMSEEQKLSSLENPHYVGSLFYLEKQWPHRFSDGYATGDRVYGIIKRKIKEADDELARGRLPLPKKGAHCSKCPWSDLCYGRK